MATKTWELFFKFHHLAGLLLFVVALVWTAFYRNHDISNWKLDGFTRNCDVFSGRWIYDHDNVSSPSSNYKEEQCSFIEDGYACQRNGRKDLRFRNWRWQPHQCNIPRFDGKAFLEKLRGKKVIFVGDSLNRNQWVSLLCLIEPSLPPLSNKALTLIGNLKYFYNIDYNVTIGFYWSPFLVESNCDNYYLHYRIYDHAVRIESIEKHATHWNDADILIFDSHTWWLYHKMTLLWGSFGSPDAINKTVEMRIRRYEMAIGTWSDWVEMNINRTKTKLFFMGATPYVTARGALRYCYYKTEPIFEAPPIHSNGSVMDEEFEWRAMDEELGWRALDEVLESAIEKLKKRGMQIEYLGITNMSLSRNDAHPSIYWPYGAPSHPELAKNLPLRYSDCLHWCLPGVPDVWNQILYGYIMKS